MLDEKNNKILQLLDGDGRMSLTDIGKELGMSPAAVKKRLDKMTDGVLRVKPALNSEELNLRMATLLLEMQDDEAEKEIIDIYIKCPRILFLTRIIGEYSILALMVVENQRILESEMRKCSPRINPKVRKSELIAGQVPIKPSYIQYVPPNKNDKEVAPCGKSCSRCALYKEGGCVGCPATRFYQK